MGVEEDEDGAGPEAVDEVEQAPRLGLIEDREDALEGLEVPRDVVEAQE